MDENLVFVEDGLSSEKALGRSAAIPAGGENAPWRPRVSFSAGTDRVLAFTVFTGGHLSAVERFAITGVRLAAAAAG